MNPATFDIKPVWRIFIPQNFCLPAYIARGPLHTAHELGEQLLHLAENTQDSALLLQACDVMGMTLFALGEFSSARMQLERGIALYDPQRHHSLALLFGLDPGVDCRSWLAEKDETKSKRPSARVNHKRRAHPLGRNI